MCDLATNRHGDAAFADYLINTGVAWRLGKEKEVVFKQFEDLPGN
ncbi:MAG TPA: hypothetical protein PKC76_06730 [Saprospiraceae bacterium]|nr:hypothetical protein [Saprospiraceae bacterium]HMP23807.1 hypothetical protein [Saprospiraceae bacterium]